MAKAPSVSDSKLSLWVSMLLVWNIALLCIAIFFLFQITRTTFSPEDLARVCAERFSSLTE